MRKSALLQLQETIILKNNDLEKSFEEPTLKITIRMFSKINLLQKANLKENLL